MQILLLFFKYFNHVSLREKVASIEMVIKIGRRPTSTENVECDYRGKKVSHPCKNWEKQL